MSTSDSEKASHFRAASRQAVSLAGALQAAGPDRDPDVAWSRDVRVVNLGLGGACIEASEAVTQGTQVELVLDTPHLWDPLTLGGVVAWTQRALAPEGGGALVGVRFEHTTGSTVRMLTELLEAEAFA
jgi:hypothetical protein